MYGKADCAVRSAGFPGDGAVLAGKSDCFSGTPAGNEGGADQSGGGVRSVPGVPAGRGGSLSGPGGAGFPDLRQRVQLRLLPGGGCPEPGGHGWAEKAEQVFHSGRQHRRRGMSQFGPAGGGDGRAGHGASVVVSALAAGGGRSGRGRRGDGGRSDRRSDQTGILKLSYGGALSLCTL